MSLRAWIDGPRYLFNNPGLASFDKPFDRPFGKLRTLLRMPSLPQDFERIRVQ